MLRIRDDAGRALSIDDKKALLRECRSSRSRSLYVAVEITLGTCMRYERYGGKGKNDVFGFPAA